MSQAPTLAVAIGACGINGPVPVSGAPTPALPIGAYHIGANGNWGPGIIDPGWKGAQQPYVNYTFTQIDKCNYSFGLATYGNVGLFINGTYVGACESFGQPPPQGNAWNGTVNICTGQVSYSSGPGPGPGPGPVGGSGPGPGGANEIDVQIVDSTTNQGIAGASVSLTAAGSATPLAWATTDSQGYCNFTNVANGQYSIQATASNYAPNSVNVTMSGQNLKVILALTPSGTTTGGGVPGCGNPPAWDGSLSTVSAFVDATVSYWCCALWYWLGQGWADLINTVWQNIPANYRAGLRAVRSVMNLIPIFLNNPQQVLQSVGLWLIEVGNTPQAKAATRFIAQAISQGENDTWQFAQDFIEPILSDAFGTVVKFYTTQILQLSQMTGISSDDLETQMIQLRENAVTQILSWAVLLELIPTINLSSIGELAREALDTIGGNELHDRRVSAHFQSGADNQFAYEANATHLLGRPQTSVLQALYAKGDITLAELEDNYGEISGTPPAYVQYMIEAARMPPTLQDVIIWNRRHPDAQIPLSNVADLTGTDTIAFANLIGERQWTDPSLIAARTLAKIGGLTQGDINSLLTRIGYRTDTLPGQSMSDFAMMQKYLSMLYEPTILKELVNSTRRMYVENLTTLDVLTQVAERLYDNDMELGDFLATAKNDYALKWQSPQSPKWFSYTQLIKMAESGEDVQDIMDPDLIQGGWDELHRYTIEDYIIKTLAAKGVAIHAVIPGPKGL